MTPQTTHIILMENGDHRPLTGSAPPSDDLIRGVETALAKQARGGWIARMTGMPREGKLTMLRQIGQPGGTFEAAQSRFLERNKSLRGQMGNQSMFNN